MTNGNRPTCPKCGAGNINMRVDGSLYCKRCGKESTKEEVEKDGTQRKKAS